MELLTGIVMGYIFAMLTIVCLRFVVDKFIYDDREDEYECSRYYTADRERRIPDSCMRCPLLANEQAGGEAISGNKGAN